jgi:hypothetical protein
MTVINKELQSTRIVTIEEVKLDCVLDGAKVFNAGCYARDPTAV